MAGSSSTAWGRRAAGDMAGSAIRSSGMTEELPYLAGEQRRGFSVAPTAGSGEYE